MNDVSTITVEEAAKVLGIDTFDLAEYMRNAVSSGLATIGDQIRRRDLTDLDNELEHFDELITGIRKLLTTAIAADIAWHLEEAGEEEIESL